MLVIVPCVLDEPAPLAFQFHATNVAPLELMLKLKSCPRLNPSEVNAVSSLSLGSGPTSAIVTFDDKM